MHTMTRRCEDRVGICPALRFMATSLFLLKVSHDWLRKRQMGETQGVSPAR